MPRTVKLRVIPRSSRDEIVGIMQNGTLKVKLTAAPVDGQANKKLLELLSKTWDVPKTKLRIVRGETGRDKSVEVLD